VGMDDNMKNVRQRAAKYLRCDQRKEFADNGNDVGWPFDLVFRVYYDQYRSAEGSTY
jgi:hypothetical protein